MKPAAVAQSVETDTPATSKAVAAAWARVHLNVVAPKTPKGSRTERTTIADAKRMPLVESRRTNGARRAAAARDKTPGHAARSP